MAIRHKRKAAEVAREAIRSTVKTIKKKPRKPIHKHSTVHIKRTDSVVPKQDDVMVTSSEPQSNHSTIQADANQLANYDKSENSPSAQIDDLFYEQLKKLPEVGTLLFIVMIKDFCYH
uniref:Uncharacterized protein n=1 Tax=Onchocerca volvulus TaxID=6282 RepID=A0A8R1XYD2_ONCVO